MISSILIQVIPHDKQRYETVGDWEVLGNSLKISVSDTGDWRYNNAIALHELTEALLCVDKGITQESVDEFDKAFEANRIDDREPGDSPDAPYNVQHGFASAPERMLIAAMGLNWQKYEEAIDYLCKKKTQNTTK